MKYIIYGAVALLMVWSVWYFVRSIRRQMKGKCPSCSGGCGGNCNGCPDCGEEKR